MRPLIRWLVDRKGGSVRSKRQQTMAKITRERMVKERRALKLEKKQAAREAKAAEDALAAHPVEDEPESPDPRPT
jgi:hypothetical protein